MLSVIIITKNEAHNIAACLNAIQFADEIIIIDSGSTDNTLEICRKFTPHVFSMDWPGFGKQKNRALTKTSHDWVLSIDADEIVSAELSKEILPAIKQNHYVAYSIPFRSNYCGKFINHGAWRRESHIRLFNKNFVKFTDHEVHESLIINGKIGKLNNPIFHYSYIDLDEVLTKINVYSTAGALLRAQKGKSSSLSKAVLHGLWTFIRDYFIKLGFLDGREGFMLAVSNAEGCYYRYLKLMYLADKKN